MKLVTFGDSIAFGACATRVEYKWCNVVANHLKDFLTEELVLENKGLPGDTLPRALERLATDVLRETPDVLICAYGLNDLRAGRTVPEILTDYGVLLDRVRAETNTRRIVVVSVFPMREEPHSGSSPNDGGTLRLRIEFNRALESFARRRNAIYVNAEPPKEAAPRLVHPDGVHPNNLGHRFIGNAVANTMLTSTLLESLWVRDHNYKSVGNYGKQTTRYP